MRLTDIVNDKADLSHETTVHQWPYWIFSTSLSLGAMFHLLLCGDTHINWCINFINVIL